MNSEENFREATPIGLLELKNVVASLIFLWSDIEGFLGDAIIQMEGTEQVEVPHGIRRRLDLWRCLHAKIEHPNREHQAVVDEVSQVLANALKIRNGICHRLKQYTLSPRGIEDEVGVTFELNGEIQTIKYSQLRSCVRQLGAMEAHISRLTFAVQNPEKPGLQGLYDDIRSLLAQSTLTDDAKPSLAR